MIKLLKGDCLVRMKEIPDKSIDCVIADPPYIMTKRGKSCRPNWMPDNMGENVFDGDIPNFHDWLFLCYQKLKNDSHIYIFTNTVSLQRILNDAIDIGFKLHNIITMIKDTNMPNRWYLKCCELVLFMRKGLAYPINDMTSKDWLHVVMPKQKDGKLHVTQKPVKPIRMFVHNSTPLNGIILDPFMGSGTTGIACLNTGRSFIGIEKDDKYFSIAKNRILTRYNELKVR